MKRKIFLSFFIIVFVISNITIIKYFYNVDHNKIELYENKKVYSLTDYTSKIETSSEDAYGLIYNYEEYIKFIKIMNLKEIEDDKITSTNFNKYGYVYHIYYSNPCSEIIEFKNISYKNNNVMINYDVSKSCGVCRYQRTINFIPLLKKINVNNIDVNYRYTNEINCDLNVAYKPMLYLYPKKKIEVDIKLKYADRIITSYPKYNNGWHVLAEEDGSIYINDKYYYGLYWDEYDKSNVSFEEGFIVPKDKIVSFLEEKLSIIGLNRREQNEFIIYWLPIMEKNEYNLVYFELTEERQSNNNLIILPEPDSLLRLNMHIKSVDKDYHVVNQSLKTFERKGFTVVEWGGTIH